MSYNESGKQITRETLLKALNRLGDLLREKNKCVDLVCCGGVVSVLYHQSRWTTHDVDVLFPDNKFITDLLKTLIEQVGEELNLEHGSRDMWFNDSVSFIGLDTRSDTVVFNHPYLILRAAEWVEMIAHKVTAFRGERDITDAIHFLKEIKDNDPVRVLENVSKYRPFVPTITDELFQERFMLIWKRAYG